MNNVTMNRGECHRGWEQCTLMLPTDQPMQPMAVVYCALLFLVKSSVNVLHFTAPPSPSATEGEGLSAGAIAGIVISAVVVVVVVVSSIIVGILVYYKPWRRQQREPHNEKTELKSTRDY